MVYMMVEKLAEKSVVKMVGCLVLSKGVSLAALSDELWAVMTVVWKVSLTVESSVDMMALKILEKMVYPKVEKMVYPKVEKMVELLVVNWAV